MESIRELMRATYEVVESKSKRIKRNEYSNELIIINTDTYEKYLLKFKSHNSGFDIKGACEVCVSAFNYRQFGSDMYFKMEESRDFIKEDGVFFTMTKIDE